MASPETIDENSTMLFRNSTDDSDDSMSSDKYKYKHGKDNPTSTTSTMADRLSLHDIAKEHFVILKEQT
jgi:hypothetical protein